MTTTWLVRCGDGGRHIDDAVSRGIITVDFSAATDVTARYSLNPGGTVRVAARLTWV